MNSPLSWNLRVAVREGQLDAGRALMEEMVEATKAETGTLAYEWFLDAEGAACHIHERYADSAAAMVHIDSFGAHFAERFLACFEPAGLAVYGEPSAEVRVALDPFGAAYLATWGGFAK